jgi:hypothetical protein
MGGQTSGLRCVPKSVEDVWWFFDRGAYAVITDLLKKAWICWKKRIRVETDLTISLAG